MAILVDASVWVDHFRQRNVLLSEQLEADQVWTHPFVIGELACGSLSPRNEIVRLLSVLDAAPLIDHDEALAFLDRRQLSGRGLGWIGVHLLASANLLQLPLWSRDKRLAAAARELGLAPAF